MKDDILIRLRHMAWFAPEGEPWVFAHLEAADEIERLRSLIRQVSPLLSSYGDGSVVYPDEAAVIAAVQEEARRG